jgi:LacI family transcriptional regulator
VIQGAKNVRPATREKVEHAIEEMGYVPSAVAQSLRSKRTRSLALMVSDITNTFWTTVARGVEDVAHRHDYSVLLCNTDENLAKQRRYLDFLISQQVDGVIIAPYDSDAKHLEKLRARGIPTVLIDRRIEGWDTDSVCTDSMAGARALVRHLISLGHERIAVVSGPAITSTAEERVAGYCIALAEAGIPLDPHLIRRGEFRHVSGEQLTYRLLDDGPNPTAIFAANNAIAMGVVDALANRGLRIPQDVALVSFDDLPNASRLFPFLTVVAQPVYDLGVNAAQLLLSRLDSETPLRPRHVVLPSRLIVRHSCGSKLEARGESSLSLPIATKLGDVEPRTTMVKPLTPEERRSFSAVIAGITAPVPSTPGRLSAYDKSDVDRLLKVLRHQEADRVPHLELTEGSRRLYEYVLEHELEYDATSFRVGGLSITPEDHVEFALRLGMDAVPCPFSWLPGNADPTDLEPPPSLVAQLSLLERYLRAAQGTSVGIIARFTSFFDGALRAAGVTDASRQFAEQQLLLELLMDALLQHQARVMRVVCDRFADDLALIVVRDRLADTGGSLVLPDHLITHMFQRRMAHLIAPAKEHGQLLLMHTRGVADQLLTVLCDTGFQAIHLSEFKFDEALRLRKEWAGRLAVAGSIPAALLARGTKEEIEEEVRNHCIRLAPGGGYVLSSSDGMTEEIPPDSFVTMAQAVHKYGRYGSLGNEGHAHEDIKITNTETISVEA